MDIIKYEFWTLIIAISVALYLSKWGWYFKTKVTLTEFQERPDIVDNLKNHVFKLSSKIGNRSVRYYENLIKAEHYIVTEFKTIGYEVILQEYTINGKILRNIIAQKQGTGENLQTIIVGAHYDTFGNPGADDNASGIAGVIELARLFYPKQVNNNIRFIAFVNEEAPYFKTKLMGSMVYSDDLKSKGESIKGAIILEMIGYYSDDVNSQSYPIPLGIKYPNKGNFILAVANRKSKDLLYDFSKSFKRSCGMPLTTLALNVEGTDYSDNWSFWENGYKALMITDTAFYRNANYHTDEDTYETLNYEYMSETVKGLFHSIYSLADEQNNR